MNRWPATLLLAFPLVLLSGGVSPRAPGLELLRRAASNYRAAETFWIEGDIRADARSGDRDQSTTASFSVAVGAGNRLHDELDHPQVGVVRISDGTQSWIYLTSTNQYVRKDGADPIDLSKPNPNGGMLPVLLMNLRGMATDVDSVRVLADDRVPFDGEDRPCAVVDVKYKPPVGAPAGVPPAAWRRFWLDMDRDLVLQHRTTTTTHGADGASLEQTETFRYTRIALNQPIEPSLFTFVPPAGANQVQQFGRGGAIDLSGQTAGDFTLPDLAGRQHSLKDLRGKVVMLDFWATWCGPCRMQMPLVDKLAQEMKEKGLVVFAVNQGESSETARRFFERNKYSTTALLDQKAEVGRRYKVSGIPTLVIIDREGKIAAHYVGLHNEEALRQGLKKAGL